MAIHKDFNISVGRRGFFRRSMLGTLGMTGAAQTFHHLGVMNAAAAGSAPTDFKALVCIFLRGGCDMNNFLIPRDTNPQAEKYTTERGVVGIPNGSPSASGDNTLPLTALTGDPFGLHPNLPGMANMFNTGELGVVANCGTLAEVVTPTNYSNAILPVQLFSHADQVTQWMAGSEPEKPFNSGWGGRIAKEFGPDGLCLNPDSKTSMLITVAGNAEFLSSPGGSVPQYAVTDTGAISLAGYGTNYASAINSTTEKYLTSNTGRRLETFEDVMLHEHTHILEDGYNTVVKSARANEATVGEALVTANATTVDFDGLFPNTDLGRELKMVAQLIAGRGDLGNNRQIYFVDQGGYDTHQDINADQPDRFDELDGAVSAFNQAMKDLAADGSNGFDYNDVIGFQASDFNRTWTPNGTDPGTSGTDHAWGTHAFVFGGPVNGGQIFGTFPQLDIGGINDVPSGGRGRWIPTTAVDQYSAVLAKWLGVPSADLGDVFPNLSEFADPFGAGANLDMIDFLA